MYSARAHSANYSQRKSQKLQQHQHQQDMVKGRISSKDGSKKHPLLHGRKRHVLVYRKLFRRFWLKNQVLDALIQAYIDDNVDWFIIVCRYYPAPVLLLEILHTLILGKFPDPDLLSPLDRRRISKVQELSRCRSKRYLEWIDAKIYYSGATLVKERDLTLVVDTH